MAEKTGIAWTDSTFNPWWGCTKVAPGCDNCYAATLDHRTGGKHWEPLVEPRTMSTDNWRKPRKWNKTASESNVRHKVFCGSMCDWADNHAPSGQRDRLWDLIRETPSLDWQLLTKRAPNIWLCAFYGWNHPFFNLNHHLQRSRPRLEYEVHTQSFASHRWLELLLKTELPTGLRCPPCAHVWRTRSLPG